MSSTIGNLASGSPAQTTDQLPIQRGPSNNFSLTIADVSTAVAATIVVPATSAAVSHNFLTAYNSTTGLFSKAQPAAADVTGLATVATTGAYTDLSGKPTLAATSTAVLHNFLTAYDSTTGLFTKAQPAASDVTGLATVATSGAYSDLSGKPTLAATSAAVAHNFLTAYDSTTGLFTKAQPAATDVTGLATVATTGAWSDLQAAGAGLTLANAGFGTEFDQTSAVNWTWKNTTVATALTTNGSPVQQLAANYWTGAASALDTWSLATVLAAGTNATSKLSITHSGSTGAATVAVPAISIPASGTGTPASVTQGFYSGAGSRMSLAINGSGICEFRSASINAGSGVGYTWSSGATPDNVAPDTGLTRIGAASVALGNGAASDVSGALTLTTETHQSANGAQWVHGQASELLTLSTAGLTTTTAANLLPANAIIEAVVCRVTTAITVTTNWAVGDSTTTSRFSPANATLALGTTSVGLAHWSGAVTTLAAGPSQAAAAKVQITCTGSNPGAGAIRITVFYRSFVAPTS